MVPRLLSLILLLLATATGILSWQKLRGDEASSPTATGDVSPQAGPRVPPPPLRQWLPGTWHLAETRGALVLKRAKGEFALSMHVAQDRQNPDLFTGTVTSCGTKSGPTLGVAAQVGEAILRFRFLEGSSQRGGNASFRVSRRVRLKGKTVWVTLNDFARVDHEGGTLYSTVGNWIRE